MKWLKIAALILLTLAAMRLGSWSIGWLITKVLPAGRTVVAIVSNVAALAVFVALLVVSLLPGEPLDVAAVIFGVVVFALCAAGDVYWRPWKPRTTR